MKKELANIDRVLFVVDVNNGFLKEGNLADPGIKRILPAVKNTILEYRKDTDLVIELADCHNQDSIETKEYFPIHCMKDTKETELVDEIKNYQKDMMTIKKNALSAMMTKELPDLLTKLPNLECIELVGCCSDLCILTNALDLRNYFMQHNRNVKIKVKETAVDTYHTEEHDRNYYNQLAFDLMELVGIEVIRKERRKGIKTTNLLETREDLESGIETLDRKMEMLQFQYREFKFTKNILEKKLEQKNEIKATRKMKTFIHQSISN